MGSKFNVTFSSVFPVLPTVMLSQEGIFVSNIFGQKDSRLLGFHKGKGVISESVFVGCMWILKVIKIQSFTRVCFFFLLPSPPFFLSPVFFFLLLPFSPTPLYHRPQITFSPQQKVSISFLSPPIPFKPWKTILSLISSPSPINVFDGLRKSSIVLERITHSPSQSSPYPNPWNM